LRSAWAIWQGPVSTKQNNQEKRTRDGLETGLKQQHVIYYKQTILSIILNKAGKN
jgi:hypothetical protein